ncbi:hypothetical protein KBD08_01650 [Candidatus Babeliales bacterium]|nr:hypothetical protein [Candidatus Babeliales bacterium]
MKRILLVGLLTGVGVVQGSFNPLLLKGTTEALMQAADALQKSEPVAQGKAAKAKKQVVPQGAEVTQRSLTDVEKKLYEDCAPFWGLMYLEKGIAEQWYRLSPQHVCKGFSQEKLEAMSKLGIPIKNNSVENLIAQMYHIAGTEGAFVVTNAPENPVKLFEPKDIGIILKLINESLIMKGDDFAITLTEKLKVYCKDMQTRFNAAGSKFQPKHFARFIEPLVNAVVECQKEGSPYTKSTPQQLLISYMLAKSSTKQDLKDYMSGLLGNDEFKLDDGQYNTEEIDKILKLVPSLNDIKSFSEYVSAAIYKQNYGSKLPKMASEQQIVFKKYKFTNCTEAMMENLINIMTYDLQKHEMGKTTEEYQMHQKLKDFYNTPENRSNLSSNANHVHQNWSMLFENQTGILYSGMVDPSTGSLIEQGLYMLVEDQDLESLQPLSPIDRMIGTKKYTLYGKEIGNRQCLIIPKSSGLECCELEACLNNVVSIMSRYFDFNFNMSNEDMFNLEFVVQKFQDMCTKLGWQMSTDLHSFIQSMYGKCQIDTNHGSFDLFLDGHGELHLMNQEEFVSTVSLDEIVQVERSVLATCLGSNICRYNQILDKRKDAKLTRFVNLDRANFDDYRVILLLFRHEGDENYNLSIITKLVQDQKYGICIELLYSIMHSGQRSLAFFVDSPEFKHSKIMINLLVDNNDLFRMLNVFDDHFKNYYFGDFLDFIIKRYLVNNQVIQEKLIQDFDTALSDPSILNKSNILYALEKMIINNVFDLNHSKKLFDFLFKSDASSVGSILKLMIQKDILGKDQSKKLLDFVNKLLLKSDVSAVVGLLEAMINKGVVGADQGTMLLGVVNILIQKDTFGVGSILELMIQKDIVGEDQSKTLLDIVNKLFLKSDASEAVRVLKVMIDKGVVGTNQVTTLLDIVNTLLSSKKNALAGIDIFKVILDKGFVGKDQFDSMLDIFYRLLSSKDHSVLWKGENVFKLMIQRKIIQPQDLLDLINTKREKQVSVFVSVMVKKSLIGKDQSTVLLEIVNTLIAKSDYSGAVVIIDEMIQQDIVGKDQNTILLEMINQLIVKSDDSKAVRILNRMIDKRIVGKDQGKTLLEIVHTLLLKQPDDAVRILDGMIGKDIMGKDQSKTLLEIAHTLLVKSDSVESAHLLSTMINKDIVDQNQISLILSYVLELNKSTKRKKMGSGDILTGYLVTNVEELLNKNMVNKNDRALLLEIVDSFVSSLEYNGFDKMLYYMLAIFSKMIDQKLIDLQQLNAFEEKIEQMNVGAIENLPQLKQHFEELKKRFEVQEGVDVADKPASDDALQRIEQQHEQQEYQEKMMQQKESMHYEGDISDEAHVA